ncbi:hypothetical protein [Paraburkholderia sp. DHOC27]|uniref:hypothetical protein n=1 Tax=Paraburkholderia sp. DHOC27 TaxID=2303330 RepID=UPI000E3EB308|nr:hypothetical protein [Paraburkholderia sp. DHOC27]RFU48112.1 hypothetical protein D0B32_11430 [Paraburkholderia sp. DHOC27]
MNSLSRGPLFALRFAVPFACLLTLATGTAHAQTVANYGDAPAAEAQGAAAAANRAANGNAFNATGDDAQLLGGPAAYGDAYQPRQPAAGANGQGTTAFEHMLNDPGTPQARNAPLPKAKAGAAAGLANGKGTLAAGAQAPAAGNAALQLYGDGTATGAARHEIYKSPW